METIVRQYTIDKKTVIAQSVDFQLFGTGRRKTTRVVLLILTCLMVVNAVLNTGKLSIALLILYMALILIIGLVILYRAHKEASALDIKNTGVDVTVKTGEGRITAIGSSGAQIVFRQDYRIADCTEFSVGLQHIFLWFGKENITLRKDNVSVQRIKELQTPHGNDTMSKKQAGLRFHLVMMAIGACLGAMGGMGFLQSEAFPTPDATVLISTVICGGVMLLWMSVAWVFYQSWYENRSLIWRVLSIVMFPITWFIFMVLALIAGIPYMIRQRRYTEDE